MFDEKLKEIIIFDSNTKEVIALIDNDDRIVAKNDVDIILNYSKDKKSLKSIDGKVFINDEEVPDVHITKGN